MDSWQTIVPHFNPTRTISLAFGLHNVSVGELMKLAETQQQPTLTASAGSQTVGSDLYTLILSDPDAPSPTFQFASEFLHWMVADIPENSSITQGRVVTPYAGPAPPAGTHRYTQILYRQPAGGLTVQKITKRARFNSKRFMRKYNLIPVAAFYFQAKPNN